MPDASLSQEIRVPVPLGPRAYEVRVVSGDPGGCGPFARSALDATWAGKACRAALIVTDRNVAGLDYLPDCRAALDRVGIAGQPVVLPAGEPTKSLESAVTLYDELIAMQADRHTVVVALGGGVIGDLAGFVAATYARGLPLLMLPTSLLAQVDSSVGGKVGVNHPRAKNIIGAFHQPVGVWIDTETLNSLPARELRCGLAEVVKYGVILDADFFADLETRAQAHSRPPGRGPADDRRPLLPAQGRRGGQDEREETGLRAVLNFGHTVGHAIEAVAGYDGAFQHGEAVAAGMVAECRLAERLGWIGPEVTQRLIRLLERFGLPTAISGLDPDRLLEAMGRDKKNQRGQIRFVLPRATRPRRADRRGQSRRRACGADRPLQVTAQARIAIRLPRPVPLRHELESSLDHAPSETDISDLVLLTMVPGVGPHTCGALLERFRTAGRVLDASLADLRDVPGVGPKARREDPARRGATWTDRPRSSSAAAPVSS